jgi:hypothetical protein
MNPISAFSVFVFICLGSSIALAQVKPAEILNEARQIRFAERVVAIELARALSPSMRAAREKCQTACTESGALELAIGLIGVSKSDASAEALINLLGLRLDGAGSEELSCQILIRGSILSRRIERSKAKQMVDHCQLAFLEARKHELRDVADVKIEQVCRTEVDIQKIAAELLKAIKSKTKCEQ